MEHKAGTLQFKENWKFETVNKETGEILDTQEFCNMIMDAGRTRVAELINGVSSTYFQAIAIGTGTSNPTDPAQTALGTETHRSAATLTNGTMPPYTAIFAHTFTFGGDFAITEAGIFDNPTSGGAMLSRLVFTAKNVSTLINLIVTATITIA